ncbi:hypothetical protein ASG77_02800 [Arthrobacter sp. Soil762]|nr:hypothetical protein ASG77_02800 [Arthrobacter sp. Soil762]
MATSVPAPIVMPTSARASAVESFAPSQTIANFTPALEFGDLLPRAARRRLVGAVDQRLAQLD